MNIKNNFIKKMNILDLYMINNYIDYIKKQNVKIKILVHI